MDNTVLVGCAKQASCGVYSTYALPQQRGHHDKRVSDVNGLPWPDCTRRNTQLA